MKICVLPVGLMAEKLQPFLMLWIKNSRKMKNQSIFISGCPCHLVHIAATAANDSFTEVIDVNVEDVLIDLYYWFDKSSKHKRKLAEYFEFCDQEYRIASVKACHLPLAFFGMLY